jgi:hypothetical protein
LIALEMRALIVAWNLDEQRSNPFGRTKQHTQPLPL